MVAERGDLARGLKVGAHIGVKTGFTLESLLATWIGKGPTIEHESSTMPFALKREHMRG
jgi:hypothetical protein